MKIALAAALAVVGLIACKDDAEKKQAPATAPVADPEPTIPTRPGEWVAYTSELGGFSIRFPAEPTEKIQVVQSPHGPVDVHMAVVDMESRAFLVSWQLQAAKPTATAKDLLDGARDAMLAGLSGATLVEEKDLAIGAYPGRSEVIKLAEPAGMQRSRIYLVGDKLISVAAISAGDQNPAAAHQFLESFALALPPAGQ